MKHKKKFNHLSRTSAHRKAMLANMACSLIMHKRIKTTVAKAKALRMYVEPLINKSKNDSTHSRRMVFRYLQNKEAVTELFRDISEKVANRPGGYTRILKLGNRQGDAAEMCLIELVDYNENMLSAKSGEGEKKRTRRSRRGKKSSKSQAAEQVAETSAENTSAVEDAEVVEDSSSNVQDSNSAPADNDDVKKEE
ncbi:50S ribosomal protein L17 [Thermophagus xiamenensis]|uniref:Large ribosomal subunit protein bL17 n=1 Tax=Thermophagus xiamenensis TaxID=385682 RepID=A0A1I1YTP1_9BACT|nr:large subunit ribosomal protein L17 [Thermophagus xiamenensis]